MSIFISRLRRCVGAVFVNIIEDPGCVGVTAIQRYAVTPHYYITDTIHIAMFSGSATMMLCTPSRFTPTGLTSRPYFVDRSLFCVFFVTC